MSVSCHPCSGILPPRKCSWDPAPGNSPAQESTLHSHCVHFLQWTAPSMSFFIPSKHSTRQSRHADGVSLTEDWGRERVSDLPKGTQLIWGRAKFGTQSRGWLQPPCHGLHTETNINLNTPCMRLDPPDTNPKWEFQYKLNHESTDIQPLFQLKQGAIA